MSQTSDELREEATSGCELSGLMLAAANEIDHLDWELEEHKQALVTSIQDFIGKEYRLHQRIAELEEELLLVKDRGIT